MITHAVPQQISAFQFRLFGNLTVREFAFVGTGGLFGFLIFLSPLPNIVKLPLIVFFAGGGAFAGLVPVQGRPFDKWLINFFKAVFSPTQRIWVKSAQIPYFLQPAIIAVSGPTLTPFTLTESKLRLEDYLRNIPSQATPLDAAERLFLDSLDFGQKMPAGVAIKFTPTPTPKPTIEKIDETTTPTSVPAGVATKEIVSLPKTDESLHTLPGLEGSKRRPFLHPKKAVNLASEINYSEEQIIVIPQGDQTKIVPGVGNLKVRRLHSQPDLFGEINLPVRSEKRFELSDELKKRFGITESESETQITPAKAPTITISDREITRSKVSATPVSIPKPQMEKPQQPPPKEKIETIPTKMPLKTTPTTIKPVIAKIPPITNTPNVLSGIVIDNKGFIAEGAIILVKNEVKIPVRALKTNKLGQFVISTPLPNSDYTIETEKEGSNFDIIEIQAHGEIMPPIEIRGK